MTVLDNYFPFDTGPGATATAARWRLMARLFAGSGIIGGYLNSCNPTLAGSTLTIDQGAIWLDGFYGENDSSKTVSVSGGDGMAVARMDPTNRTISFYYVVGQSVPTQSLSGIYEIPVARVASGTLIDIRQYSNPGNTPPGVIWDYGGSTAPPGWLLCDGTSYVRTDYSALFARIGTTWGAADGSHFNVPDYRGRVSIGAGQGPGLTLRALGSSGGEELHVLSTGELSVHSHTLTDPGHLHTGIFATGIPGTDGGWVAVKYPASAEGTAGAGIYSGVTFAGPGGVTTGNGATGATVGNQGSGTGHNNIQPYATATKIIKT